MVQRIRSHAENLLLTWSPMKIRCVYFLHCLTFVAQFWSLFSRVATWFFYDQLHDRTVRSRRYFHLFGTAFVPRARNTANNFATASFLHMIFGHYWRDIAKPFRAFQSPGCSSATYQFDTFSKSVLIRSCHCGIVASQSRMNEAKLVRRSCPNTSSGIFRTS